MIVTKWYARSIYLMLALALVLSLGIVAMPMAGTVGAIPLLEVWVCPTGDCGHPGVQYKTIQGGIDNVAAGGTVHVAAGTYNENVNVDKTGLILAGDDKNTTTIDAGGSGVVVAITADDVTVSGFTVTGSGSTPLADGGIGLSGITGCTIEDNIVGNNGGIGIGLQGADSNTIQGNTLNLNSIAGIGLLTSDNNIVESNISTGTLGVNTGVDYKGYGIVLDYTSTGNTVNGNTFSANEVDGVYFGEGSNGNTLTNNTITDNGKTGGVDSNGIYFWNSDDNTVTGNTITGNLASGMQLFESQNNEITENTITGNNVDARAGEGGILIQSDDISSTGNVINFNNIAGNTYYGINTDIAVDAENNWWGTDDGPSGAGPGSGDAVTANVDYDPWLGAELTEVESETISGSGTLQDTPTGGDINIVATGNHTITVATYTEVPAGTSPFTNNGSYYDIHLESAVNVTSLTVQFCPALEGEIISYWDGASWVTASNQVYADGCITVTITSETMPSLEDLTGTPFGQGFMPPVGGEAYSVNSTGIVLPWVVLGTTVIAGSGLLILRRRKTKRAIQQ